MKGVELYGRVRHAVEIEGLSRREAARRFWIDPRTVAVSASSGNGTMPTWLPPQLGCWSVVPMPPHFERCAERRKTSLDASAPQRINDGTRATGLWCPRPRVAEVTQTKPWGRIGTTR